MDDKPLTIAVAQPRCVLGDIAANAAIHAATVRTAGARVVVFPELSLTGYRLDADAVTETDRRLKTIVRACVPKRGRRLWWVRRYGARPAVNTSRRSPSTATGSPWPTAR